MQRYRAVLFLDRDAVSRLGSGGNGPIWDARLEGDSVAITWSGNRRTTLDLNAIRKESQLDARLPPPTVAFVADPDGESVGLLFESATPLPSLQFVEPHSLIFPIGWLRKGGFEAAA